MKKVKNLKPKSPQYCADTTKSGCVYAIDMRGHKRYMKYDPKNEGESSDSR